MSQARFVQPPAGAGVNAPQEQNKVEVEEIVEQMIQYGFRADSGVLITADEREELEDIIETLKERNTKVESYKYVKEIYISKSVSDVKEKFEELKKTLESAILLHKKGVSKNVLAEVFPILRPIIKQTSKSELEAVLSKLLEKVSSISYRAIINAYADAVEGNRALSYGSFVVLKLWTGEYYSKYYKERRPLYFGLKAYSWRIRRGIAISFRLGYSINLLE